MSDRTGSIRVVLVDDHAMFTQSLAMALASGTDIDVVGIATSADDGLHLAEDLEPSVVVVDQELPEGRALALARSIVDAPGDTRVVMVGRSGDQRPLLAALEAGCLGFVTIEGTVEDLVVAVEQVHKGEPYVPPSMVGALLPHVGRPFEGVGTDLTDREREVLNCLGEGLGNPAIAKRLFLSVHTVRSHVQSVLTKLGAHSKIEAVAIGRREGLLGQPRRRAGD